MAADVKEKRTRLQNALSAGENGQRDRLLLAGIFLMGSALRLYRLDAQSFWYDETTQVLISIRGFFGAIGAVVHGAENCPQYSPYTHPYAAFTVAAQFLYVLVYHRESVATLRGGSWRSSNVAMPSRITGASRTFVSRPVA